MKKWSSIALVWLFVGAVVVLPAVHRTDVSTCCAHDAGCGAGEDDSSSTADDHDASTCPLCKLAGTPLVAPVAVTGDGPSRWQIGPYVTWYQSPWVHFRLEYNHQDGDETGPSEDVAWAQCIFAAGPHLHERYQVET